MNILAESKKYIITNEFEVVYLKLKETNEITIIGDFYGDPEMALISEDESLCAVCGCGIIVYYLKNPFTPYQFENNSEQWLEFGREPDKEIWITNMQFIGENMIEIVTEKSDKIILYVKEDGEIESQARW